MGSKKTQRSSVLSEEFLKVTKFEWRGKNTVDLVRADIRNVLFCGATRSGKTNCFKVLQDPCHCPDTQTIFSETRGTNFKSFSLKDNKEKTVHSFVLSLIDSPGAFEEQSSQAESKARTNEKIGELIIECLKHEVAYLNLVVLFLPIGARIDKKDVDSIELFVSMFQNPEADQTSREDLEKQIEAIQKLILEEEATSVPNLDKIEAKKTEVLALEKKRRLPTALCLTRADGVNDDSRDGFISQIRTHKQLKKYFDDKSLFILLMGCADHKFRDFGSEQQYVDTLDDVVGWRSNFFKAIFWAKYRVDLRSTSIFGERQGDVKLLLDTCVDELKALSDPKVDFALGPVKNRLVDHHNKMGLLFKHKLIIEDRKDCVAKSGELWELILKVSANTTLKADVKQHLLEPWEWKEVKKESTLDFQ